jgi:hypothetical protein
MPARRQSYGRRCGMDTADTSHRLATIPVFDAQFHGVLDRPEARGYQPLRGLIPGPHAPAERIWRVRIQPPCAVVADRAGERRPVALERIEIVAIITAIFGAYDYNAPEVLSYVEGGMSKPALSVAQS